MQKRLIAIVILAVMTLALLSSCGYAENGTVVIGAGGRFTVEYYGAGIDVITDTSTGFQYLFYKVGYGGGLTVLLQPDSNPIMK